MFCRGVRGATTTATNKVEAILEATRELLFAMAEANKITPEGLPVLFVDERFSSREAAHYLNQGGRRRRPKEEVDAVAAEVILQRYLDGHGAPVEDDDV